MKHTGTTKTGITKTDNRKARISFVATLVLVALLIVGIALLPGCDSKTNSLGEGAGKPSFLDAPNTTEIDVLADRSIEDAAGRVMTVPGTGALKKIYYSGASAEIFCFSLAPELAGGTTFELTPEELAYMPVSMRELKYLGSQSGGKKLNLEAIMAGDIQLIVSVCFGAPTEKDISEADDLVRQTGIPVVLLNGALEESAYNYRFLGKLLGKEEDAEKLALYCEQTLAAISAAVASIPEADRISLYYAEGNTGLQTESSSSAHALIFNLAGAYNVAEIESADGKGMTDVSLEQVMAWDPEVIIVWSQELRGGAENLIKTESGWSPILAVQNGRVYTMPNTPFSWCDRPPAPNRYLGLQWLTNMLYPDAYTVDMVEVTKEFYALFFHVSLTNTQAKELLGNSYPVYREQ